MTSARYTSLAHMWEITYRYRAVVCFVKVKIPEALLTGMRSYRWVSTKINVIIYPKKYYLLFLLLPQYPPSRMRLFPANQYPRKDIIDFCVIRFCQSNNHLRKKIRI